MNVPSSNDTLDLVPRTALDGPALELDFPGLRIGVAEYDEGPTGCTVFHFPASALSSVDVRGGSPGVLFGDGMVDAICLAGGSLYGLEAAAGASAEIMAQKGYSKNWDDIALTAGAIIFDLGGRPNMIYPDKQLGRAALGAAKEGRFPLGPRGAGRSASVGNGLDEAGKEPGGQGAAFRRLGEVRLAVFVVVNAVGMVHDRAGRVFRGGLDRATGERRSYLQQLERKLAAGRRAGPPGTGNTTLTVLVTNRKLHSSELRQLGRAVHSSMARAIQPFHTVYDGDVLFAVTTNQLEDRSLDTASLSVLGGELAWDAVLSAVS